MALALGAVVHNGAYKKVFELDYLDNDAAGAGTVLAVDFTAAPFSSPLRSAPNSYRTIHTSCAADAPARVMVVTPTANGCTLRILAAGGGAGGANTAMVTVECLHSAI